MDAMSGGRCIRRTVSRGAQAFACLVLAIMALAWSNLAQAQSCDFVQVGDTTVIGSAGTTVSFTLRAETACPNPTDIVLAITSDTTGGASIVPPLNPSVPLDTAPSGVVTQVPLKDVARAPGRVVVMVPVAAQECASSPA